MAEKKGTFLMGQLHLQDYRNRHSLKSKLARALWMAVWALLFRPTPRGTLFRPWRAFLLRCFGAKLGPGANVLPSCRIWQPWRLTMGAHSCLSERVDCYNAAEVTLGDQAVVSQDAFLCTASHDVAKLLKPLTHRPIVIGSYAWVAAEAFVGMGVTVHEGAVVGARAVVAKDVPAWTIVAGNPARPIKKRVLAEA